MATSGSLAFDPTFATLMDDAFERAGVDPSTISHKHIKSAINSVNLMFTDWTAKDRDPLYRVAKSTETVASGTDYFDLPTGALDIVDITMEYNSEDDDLPISRINRDQYLAIVDKTDTGRPQVFYVDYTTLNAPRFIMWPVPDAQIDFTYDYMRYPETLGALSETMDVQRLWLEAVCAGLAARLSLKYNIARYALLKEEAKEALKTAFAAHTGNNNIRIGVRAFGATGRTLRR